MRLHSRYVFPNTTHIIIYEHTEEEEEGRTATNTNVARYSRQLRLRRPSL